VNESPSPLLSVSVPLVLAAARLACMFLLFELPGPPGAKTTEANTTPVSTMKAREIGR